MNLRLGFTKLDERALAPRYAQAGDAGLDLHALDSHTMKPFERKLIPTGIALEIPQGYAGFVLPRSGLSSKFGLTLINSPGLIDSGYRGEVKIACVNLDPETEVEIQAGDRIAQLVIMQAPQIELAEGDLSPSNRGDKGFGSSGVSSQLNQ